LQVIFCASIMCPVSFWIRKLNKSNNYCPYIRRSDIYIVARYQIAISKPDNKTSEKQPSFWIGFVLQIVNVKIFLFGVTSLTGYVMSYYSSLGLFLFFEMIIAAIGSLATLTWIFFGGLFQKTYFKHFRVINIILALLLMQCAVVLLVQ